jgi:hypothetical protein
VVVPFGEYRLDTRISYFSEGLAAVQNHDGKWGFLSLQNRF